MKLETMLLPTGEFILVVSEARAPHGEIWPEFKKSIGAAGLIVTDNEVDLVDALIDSAAKRRDVVDEDDEWWKDAPTEPQQTAGSLFIAPNDTHIPAGYTPIGALDETHYFTFDAEGDEQVIRAVNEGRTATAAGLIKGKPGDPQFSKEDLEGPTDEGVEQAQQEFQRVALRTFAVDGGGVAQEADAARIVPWESSQSVRINDQTVASVPARPPLVGDRVRIVAAAPNHVSETPIGVEGEVIDSGFDHPVPGEVYVEFWHPRQTNYTYRWFFPHAAVEVLNG